MKVAIYTKDFNDKNSKEQVELCKDYITTRYNAYYIEEIFIYDDKSECENNDNPKFKQLLNDTKANKFNILICYNLKCIFKNLKEFSSTYKIFKDYDIGFISMCEQLNTTSSTGRMMASIADAFAELES